MPTHSNLSGSSIVLGMLDVAKLLTFRAVVQRGSFSAAAHDLHLTQPAVSRQVGLLERQLGAVLVLRTRQGVRCTEAGRVLLSHAEVALGQLERAEQEVRDLVGVGHGTVRLGSFLSALVHLSAEVGAVLDRDHPGIRLVDDLVDRATALSRISGGELDLAVVFENDFEPAPPAAGVEVHHLFDDPLCVVLPAGHPLAGSAAVRLTDLAAETWIRAHEGSAARRLDLVLGRAGLHPPVLLAGRGDEPFEAQALVAAARGVALTHRLTVVVSGHQLVVRPLADCPDIRRVQVAVPSGPRTPAAHAVLRALLEVGAARLDAHGGRRPD
jgi:DNA-binding transcriptional LysR family regulator